MLTNFNGVDIKVVVANFCAVMDIFVHKDKNMVICQISIFHGSNHGFSMGFCSDPHLGRS